MKDFDVERQFRSDQDRDFKIGGEVFRAKASVRPEVLVPFDEIGEETTSTETLAIIDELVVNMLEPNDDSEARYRALRERADDAVSLDDLQELAKYLVEVQTGGRPTEQPGDSSAGPGNTGTNSTDISSSADSPED